MAEEEVLRSIEERLARLEAAISGGAAARPIGTPPGVVVDPAPWPRPVADPAPYPWPRPVVDVAPYPWPRPIADPAPWPWPRPITDVAPWPRAVADPAPAGGHRHPFRPRLRPRPLASPPQ